MKKLILLIAVALFAAAPMFAQVVDQKPASVKSTPSKEATQAEQAKRNEEARAAQQTQAAEVNNNPNAPIIKFDKEVHDYGEIEQNANGQCEFKFTNEGKEPLILSNVRSSCGCTVPEWPRNPIMPGQSDVIKVKYDTKRVGPINKTITVYSNSSVATVTLRITGKVNATGDVKIPEKEAPAGASPVIKK